METNSFIFKLKPHYVQTIWGGSDLIDMFGKDSEADSIAESWELSAHKDGMSHIAEGEYKGLSLEELVGKIGKDALGSKASSYNHFPLLIKFIDAKKPLSIQIHPNDEYAMRTENENGKNEMWYIVSAKPEAYIYYGLNREVSPEEIERKIHDGTLEDVMCKIPVKSGDVFYVKAGLIHAIGPDIIICEIQQSSNLTYRMYDYDRVDGNGEKRKLHVEKAMDVVDIPLNVELASRAKAENEKVREYVYGQLYNLVNCEYFNTDICMIKGEKEIQISEDSFRAFVFIEGEGEIVAEEDDGVVNRFVPGDTFFIAACDKKVTIKGDAKVLVVSL